MPGSIWKWLLHRLLCLRQILKVLRRVLFWRQDCGSAQLRRIVRRRAIHFPGRTQEASGKEMFLRFQHIPRHGLLSQPLNALRVRITRAEARCVWCMQLIIFFSPLARLLSRSFSLSLSLSLTSYFTSGVSRFCPGHIAHSFAISLSAYFA